MKNIKKMAMVTAILMLPLFAVSTFAQKKISLNYNLTTGQSYDVTTEVAQEISFEANEQSMTLDQIIRTKSVSEVGIVENDQLTINTTMSAMRMEQSIFGMEIIYDSEDPATMENPMAQKIGEKLQELIGSTYATTLDKKGNVVKYDLGDFAKNEEMSDNISSGNSYIVFPENKVAAGDSWEADIKPMENSDMKVHSKYTLIKGSKKQAVIKVESTITANNAQGEEIKMSGSVIGEAIVDVKTGWTIESTMDMEMELELDQNGMKFPATVSGTIILTSSPK